MLNHINFCSSNNQTVSQALNPNRLFHHNIVRAGTSDEILTWNQIYEAIGMAAGKIPDMIHIPSDFIARYDEFHIGNLLGDKAHSVIFDNSKVKSFVPEFKAIIPFKQGIKKTVKWFEEKPSRMKLVGKTNNFMDKVINSYLDIN